MSLPRVVVLCLAVALSTLVAHAITALLAGLQPGIFNGPLLIVLTIAATVCWIVYGYAVRADRLERSDRRERVANYTHAVHYIDGDTHTDSGSWRRPAMD